MFKICRLSIINPISCSYLFRPVRQLWCWLWATAGWTWCRHSWHRGRRSISRMMRAPRRWCVQASMAMLTLWNYCWHSQTVMPPSLTVYVTHLLPLCAASVSPVASSCELFQLCLIGFTTKAESELLLKNLKIELEKQKTGSYTSWNMYSMLLLSVNL